MLTAPILARCGFVLLLASGAALAGDTPACPKPAPSACDDAKNAMTAAESVMQAAAAKLSLWTTADDALKQSRAAFRAGDYASAARAARIAAEQAQLGIAQTRYPKFDIPKL